MSRALWGEEGITQHTGLLGSPTKPCPTDGSTPLQEMGKRWAPEGLSHFPKDTQLKRWS